MNKWTGQKLYAPHLVMQGHKNKKDEIGKELVEKIEMKWVKTGWKIKMMKLLKNWRKTSKVVPLKLSFLIFFSQNECMIWPCYGHNVDVYNIVLFC